MSDAEYMDICEQLSRELWLARDQLQRAQTLLRDWQQWAEWFAGVHHRPDTSIQTLKARTQEVLKP
jgi:hypothetical protein